MDVEHTACGAPLLDLWRSPYVALHPAGIGDVTFTNGLLHALQEVNREVVVPTELRRDLESGSIENFEVAAGSVTGDFRGELHADHGLYSWLETASWSNVGAVDPTLTRAADDLIGLAARAQRRDGYLNTYFSGPRESLRWSDLPEGHEMFLAAHLVQAAVAHARTTGLDSLLSVARRFVDHIDSMFGSGPGQRRAASGIPGLEMALVELYRLTRESRYLRLAGWLLDQRGVEPTVNGGSEVLLDHQPVRKQSVVVGHAVMAMYLYAGAADIYAETGDSCLLDACERVWKDLHKSKVYITGGVGARYYVESFGQAYELPSQRA
jgi:DUF1680 family protein